MTERNSQTISPIRRQSPERAYDDAFIYKQKCDELSIHPLKDLLISFQQSNDMVLKLQLNAECTFTDLQAVCNTLSYINRQVALRVVDLKIGNKGLVIISELLNKNDNLRSLVLKNTDISSMGIPYLCNGLNSPKCHLQELEISQSSIGTDGIEQLGSALSVNLTVKRLILNSLNLFDSSISSICRFIEANNNISLLVLENNGFTHHGMFRLCESLSRNRGVEELVMSGNPIGNEGLISISDYLLTRLTRIELDSCKIGTQGVEVFQRNLSSPNLLYKMQTQIFNLANNRIGSQGAQLLFSNLSSTFPALRALNLHNNKIGNSAMMMVSQYLKNPSNRLERLNLCQNLIDESGAVYLSETFQVNRSLREINLSKNFVSQSSASNIYLELSKWNSETRMNINNQQPKNSEFYLEENQQAPPMERNTRTSIATTSPIRMYSPKREENPLPVNTGMPVTQNIKSRYDVSPMDNTLRTVDRVGASPINTMKRSLNEDTKVRQSFAPQAGLDSSLEEFNRKIDENARDIIQLFQRRKDLLLAKKHKLQENYVNNINLTKHQRLDEKRDELNGINMKIGNYSIGDILQKNEFFLRAQTFTGILTNELENRSDESNRIAARLQDFWTTNRNLEQDVENGLNMIDDQLDSLNSEIIENCKTLDMTEERIRELLSIRTAEHISQAEPFFIQKQKIHDGLDGGLVERNIHNDEKLAKISQIIGQLENLRHIREERLRLLHEVFDDKDNQNFSQRLGILTQIIDQIENMVAMKKNFNSLCAEEETLNAQISKVQADIDILNNEFVEKHNEEARLYKQLHENLFSRTQINKVVEFLGQQGGVPRTSEEDLRNLLTIFKDKYAFFKQFIEEDYKIVDGLKKTNDTIIRLNHLVDSISHEKMRRTDLYQRLESIANLKSEEYNKSEALRKLDVEITKKDRQKAHIEEDLMYMRNEADLETYKKIGQVLNIHDNSLNQLNNERVYLMREIDKLNQQIYQQISACKSEYEDILKEIFPSDWVTRFDLTRLQDITYVKATMTHTFKRLGIKKDDLTVN